MSESQFWYAKQDSCEGQGLSLNDGIYDARRHFMALYRDGA